MEQKNRKYDTNIYKAVRIADGIFQTSNKLFVTFHPKNVCKLEFSDNLWLPFLDQPQSDVMVFSIITFQMYKILVIKWNHVIGPTYMIKLNE